jgi:hypothetical protein
MGYVKKQAAKYGLKGSRIAAMREALDTLSGIDNGVTLRDIWEYLPENEFAQKISKVNEKNGQVSNFYEVNMKKYQDTNTAEYTAERIGLALSSYGERAMLAEKNEGVDFKALSHAIRAGYQLRSILKHGTFSYPLKETRFIRKVKLGECDYKTEVSPVLEDLIDEIELLNSTSTLPAKCDVKYWNEWLLDVYWKALINPEFGR